MVNLYGRSTNAGRIVIYHKGRWGTICSTGLSSQIRDLLCEQVGFSNAEAMYRGKLHYVTLCQLFQLTK